MRDQTQDQTQGAQPLRYGTPNVLARDIVESLQAALEQFTSIAEDLGEEDESGVKASAQAAD